TGPAFEGSHCGQCRACIDECPTQAIVSEGVVDARRCISYLTIEHESAIPVSLRKAMGTRIYGCDDCQLVCPWNKFATPALWADFEPRHGLDKPDLLTLLKWTEQEFLKKTEGMAIRRIGFERFQRNLAIAAGNSPLDDQVLTCLRLMVDQGSELVKEHAAWAIEEQLKTKAVQGKSK
ncbi:MAG: tRNA epoxyqueuosine(34) reductase QueG, partial [Limnobacter sp.]|nr:tRNA epoxyqueuosine(34) reductase QueG [Limnobacter sp.]